MNRRKFPEKVYYSNPKQEFEDNGLERRKLDENYKYKKSKAGVFFARCFHYIFVAPILYLSFRLFQRVKFINKENYKKVKKEGFFIYMNHTSDRDPILLQHTLCYFKKTSIIGFSDALDTPVVGKTFKSFGLVPIPSTIKGLRNFNNHISECVNTNKEAVIIFPEQMMWPYCNYIRDCDTAAFSYPATTKKPILPLVTVYKASKRTIKYGKKPRPIVVIGEPIYPKEELSVRENKEYLKEEVMKAMNQIVEQFDSYQYVEYIQVEEDDPRNMCKGKDKVPLHKLYKEMKKEEKKKNKN